MRQIILYVLGRGAETLKIIQAYLQTIEDY